MFKKIAKRILSREVLKHWRFIRVKKVFTSSYRYDLSRFVRSSDRVSMTSTSLLGRIIREYHVIEKGLTMPECRMGFGKEVLMVLIENCLRYIQWFGYDNEQLKHAISVVLEYEMFHSTHNFVLDSDLQRAIDQMKFASKHSIFSKQKELTSTDYFSAVEAPFPKFAESRSSVRNYSEEEIPINIIEDAIEIARSTPSACNRQCWRTYLFTDKVRIKEILNVQGGNRGFGHLADKLIVVAAEVSVFTGPGERNQPFVDGGMYAMNLLYSLHYKKIAACILNCSNTIEKDKKLRELCGIRESEVFIAMVACGKAPDNIKVAVSKRHNLYTTHKTIY